MKGKFEILYKGIDEENTNTPRAKDIFYQCTKCGDIIPSQPNDNMGCKCGNIFIDNDYVRLVVKDYKHFQVLKKIK